MWAVTFATICMTYANFTNCWNTYKVFKSCMTSTVWMRTIATMNEYCDAEVLVMSALGDKEASKKADKITSRERKFALYLVEMPSVE